MKFLGKSNPVLAMLKQDHAKVKRLFDTFEEAKDSRAKEKIIKETLLELEVHAKLEETLIYPAIRKETDGEEVMDEALEEHHVAHTLINELKRRSGNNGRYEAKFKVLGESIKHHVKEEEGTMFPLAEEEADLDWESLAQKAIERKNELTAKSSRNGERRGRGKAKSGRKSRAQHLKKAA